MLDLIADKLGHPQRDPHGDPIPDASGRIARPEAELLGSVPDGFAGRVVRISDRNPNLLRYLESESVRVDAQFTVLRRRPFGSSLIIRLVGSGAELELGDEATASIWVTEAEHRPR